MKKIFLSIIAAGLLVFGGVGVVQADSITVYNNDFESGLTTNFSGYVFRRNVTNSTSADSDYRRIFETQFLWNPTGGRQGPIQPTNLLLTGLAPHESIDLNFLTALIDTWGGQDFFNVSVDGNLIFRMQFFQNTAPAPYPEALLTRGNKQGFGSSSDSAYNMGVISIFDNIPHVSNTLAISWWADGRDWNTTSPTASWAIDSVEVILNYTPPTPIPEPTTILLLGTGLAGLAGTARRRKK